MTVSDPPLVERVGRELSDHRVHPVLDREHESLVLVVEQSFKQRSTELGLLGVFGESGGGQLLLVAYKDNSLGSKLERDQGRRLDALAGFVDDQVLELVLDDLHPIDSGHGESGAYDLGFEKQMVLLVASITSGLIIKV